MKIKKNTKLFLLAPLFILFTINAHGEELTVNHLVTIWLKKDLSEHAIDQVIDATRMLSDIEQVHNLKILTPLYQAKAKSVFNKALSNIKDAICDRPGKTYSFAINMQFKNKTDLHKYSQDTIHKKYVTEYLDPSLEKITVHDSKIMLPRH